MNSYAILYMCMDIIICQLDRSLWKVDDISDPWHKGNFKSAQVGEGMWRKLFQLLGWVLQNLSFSKWDIPNLPEILTFHIFHISVFVNTTAMVVNSYAILYMCMDIIICQSDRSPQRVMISQAPSIWEPQISSGERRNVWVLQNCLPKKGYS